MDKLVRKIESPIAKNMIEKNNLYLIQKKDINKAAEIAADAYIDYPLHNWFSKGKNNYKISKQIMKISLKTMFKDAVIYADSEEMNGLVICLPLGYTGFPVLSFLFNGGFKLIFTSGFGIIKRLLTYETFAMELKEKYTKNVDWYLFNLSVKKDAQGKGIASKLIRPMLNFCDEEQIFCYLETNKESNVSLYEHFDFELAEKALIPKTDVWHYAMLRKPKK